MDENGHRENGRHKPPQGPWLMQHHPSMKQIMSIMAERDAAIQERNLALSEKKSALAERDSAIQQRDSAISDRNNAIKERDNAIATLHYRESTVNYNNAIPQPHVVEQARYNIGRLALIKGDMQITDSPEPAKSARRAKRPKKVIKQEGKPEFKPEPDSWKEQDLGLNQVSFDETSMPGPVCSCTGSLRPCYKWGNGGWQSSCCTTNLSIYPLPAVPNKRHARVGGRKMSGGAFNKLISRLAAEGHDLSNPVDLKDNWAKHGTNRYITIK